MKLLSILLIALLVVQAFVEAKSAIDDAKDDAGGNLESLVMKHHHHKINCSRACTRRCSLSSRKNLCHRACKTCCARCHCVPPGTYGNKNHCPCYASLRTHGNRPKCP